MIEAIISGIECTIKCIGQTLICCQCLNHKSNEIDHIGHRIITIPRGLSSALNEYEIINLKPIQPRFNSSMIKEYLDCKDNVKWKLLQLISPV